MNIFCFVTTLFQLRFCCFCAHHLFASRAITSHLFRSLNNALILPVCLSVGVRSLKAHYGEWLAGERHSSCATHKEKGKSTCCAFSLLLAGILNSIYKHARQYYQIRSACVRVRRPKMTSSNNFFGLVVRSDIPARRYSRHIASMHVLDI